MMDFTMGYVLGKNLTKNRSTLVQNNVIEEKEVHKVYRYVPIPDITDFNTTLEQSYYDYEKTNLVVIHKNGHIFYYLQIYVDENQIRWGDDEVLDFI